MSCQGSAKPTSAVAEKMSSSTQMPSTLFFCDHPQVPLRRIACTPEARSKRDRAGVGSHALLNREQGRNRAGCPEAEEVFPDRRQPRDRRSRNDRRCIRPAGPMPPAPVSPFTGSIRLPAAAGRYDRPASASRPRAARPRGICERSAQPEGTAAPGREVSGEALEKGDRGRFRQPPYPTGNRRRSFADRS